MRNHFKHSADRVAGAVCFVHDRFHPLFRFGIYAAEQNFPFLRQS